MEPGGRGEGAGLRVGDILVSLAGQPLQDMAALQAALAAAPTGEPFQVELLRLGRTGSSRGCPSRWAASRLVSG